MTRTALLPWHAPIFKTWHAIANKAHAYLIVAPDGTGGEHLLNQLAHSVLCENTDAQHLACGQCVACLLLQSYSHPDLRVLRPAILDVNHPIEEMRPEQGAGKPKPSKEISIAQVRGLANMVNQTSHRGGQRVILVYPAQKLNRNAANALLKTLEEPPPNTLFFLLVDDVKQLLPTIISRCQRIEAPAPSIDAGADYLNQVLGTTSDWPQLLATENGAAIRVQELSQGNYFELQQELIDALAQGSRLSALRLAEQFEKHITDAEKARLAGGGSGIDVNTFITWLQRWLHDLLCESQGSGAARYYPKHQKALQQIALKTNAIKLHEFEQQLLKSKRYAEHPLNLKTWLEHILLDYAQRIA